SVIGDVRDFDSLDAALREARPELVFHLAAQPIVRDSYRNPVETYDINVMGIVHLLESVRRYRKARAVVNVTTDKCYENREWCWGYRENDALNGFDPYSNSKSCAELVTASYRNSFFNPATYGSHGVALASARAGNVIGGGDWAQDRLIPDCVNALLKGEEIRIRSPYAVRPWQHVLESLSGYMLLAQRLYTDGSDFAEGWNFGPDDSDAKPVEWIVKWLCDRWGAGASYAIDVGAHPHEANYLKLDCSKARMKLGWRPRWNIVQALERVVEWALVYRESGDIPGICNAQIDEYDRTGEI
ncbi:MAG: CDP-glucose 4,6-dehydratase, partial [Spirochaetes bacterium]|nr:CDP-glucose 4,6-dehydratase [Spirochaetota bacterium]